MQKLHIWICHCGEKEYKYWIIMQVRELYSVGEDVGLGPFSVNNY